MLKLLLWSRAAFSVVLQRSPLSTVKNGQDSRVSSLGQAVDHFHKVLAVLFSFSLPLT